MTQKNKDEIRHDLLEILSNLVDVDTSQVKDSDRLREDLGLDSLQSMELLSRICDLYELDIEVEDVMDVQTVGDVIKELEKFMSTESNG